MTMREEFLNIVNKYGIDEVWVNFDQALDRPHVADGETYVVYKKNAYLGDTELLSAGYDIMETFAPILKTCDFDNFEKFVDSDSVHLSYALVPGLDSERMSYLQEKKKEGFRLLYSKEGGLIG